ncbi:MAG: response regulator [Gemmatimonadota bacterium]|nr:MAG: response regulator [Gemmatimonadota bacterium]
MVDRTVWVVDGDAGVRQSVAALLGTLDVGVRSSASGEELLRDLPPAGPDCLIVELYLPGMNGIELLRCLLERGVRCPVILLASDADVPMAVRAMQVGAFDFIEKPFVDRVLLCRVRDALGLVPPALRPTAHR